MLPQRETTQFEQRRTPIRRYTKRRHDDLWLLVSPEGRIVTRTYDEQVIDDAIGHLNQMLARHDLHQR